jgi:hypothetical protein
MTLLALEREEGCFDILVSFQAEEAILIGGYAISAYGLSRFSVDLDLVTAEATADRLRAVLAEKGFQVAATWSGDRTLPGHADRWSRGPRGRTIGVDLLIDGVADRRSGASFSFAELRPMASRRLVRGVDPAKTAKPLVADREVLIALKLAAGRKVDLRDVAILSRGIADYGVVAGLLQRVPKALVQERIRSLSDSLETLYFRDALKGSFVLDERKSIAYLDAARDFCNELRAAL